MILTDTEIRALSRIELPQCVPYGREFHAEFQLPGEFKPSVWLRNWQTFYDRYPATVLGLWKDGQLIGGLGALIVPDLCDGRLCASELFWFVSKEHRLGSGGIRLLIAFEDWAREEGADEARMVHIARGEHQESLARVYETRGYERLEICYRKPLKER